MKKDDNKSMQGIPSNYFESFADKVMAGIRAAHDNVPEPVLDYPKAMPYVVPEGYFEQQVSSFFDTLQAVKTFDNHDQWSRALPYQAPASSYFESLPDAILQKVKSQELETVDLSFLDHLKHLPTYRVPEGYFENFKIALPVANTRATTILFQAKKKRVQWMQWSAAACMLIIFSLGAFWMSNTPGTEDARAFEMASQQLDNVPLDVIDEYIDTEFDSYDIYASMIDGKEHQIIYKTSYSILDDVSDQDLDAYLEMEGI